jgi:ADP-ribose pyrophosphatase YjhB (NUDIX family)
VKTLNKQRVAALVKRAPWLMLLAQRIYRVGLPWRTVGVVGVVFNDQGALMIVKHVFHPRYPWGLPGGWMARHEDPAGTVRREVLEETGLRIAVLRPLLIEHTPYLPRHLDVAFLCHAPADAGTIRLSAELLDFRWEDPALAAQIPMTRFDGRAIRAAMAHGHPDTVDVLERETER